MDQLTCSRCGTANLENVANCCLCGGDHMVLVPEHVVKERERRTERLLQTSDIYKSITHDAATLEEVEKASQRKLWKNPE